MFYVIEFQTSGSSGSAIVNTYTDIQVARQRYYTIMAAASVSDVPKHGAMLLTDDLFKVMGEIAPKAIEE